MFKKLFTRATAAAMLLFVCSVAVSAQVVQISGKVTLKQADGTVVPVKDAIVDIYRVDIAGKFQTKTDKSGYYTHAGIPFGGRYTLAVSAPGARPAFAANIRLNQQPENNFALEPGDGKRLTLDEIKAGAAANPAPAEGNQPSEADKKAAAEMQKKIAEVEEQNKKIAAGNELVSRVFKAGQEAYKAKRYDEAIASFDEGIAARPDEPGLLVSKSFALIGRGVTRYNESIQSKSEQARESAYKDWRDAADLANKAHEILKAPPAAGAAADPAAQANREQNRLAALEARAESMKFVGSKVDRSQAEAAFNAYQDYIGAVADPAKKSKAQFEAANVFFEAGVYDRAAAEFEKVVAADPQNSDAYFKLGSSLLNTGDKTKYQAAANYLAKFAEMAPETNPLKAEAKTILEFLKANENVKPMKIDTPRTTRRRG